MANFKRGRAKNQRSGCLMCKPHKMNGAKKAEPIAVRRLTQISKFTKRMDLDE